jgi:hypothetical protein
MRFRVIGISCVDQLEQPLLRANATPSRGGGLSIGIRLTDDGDGTGDHFVEHLGHDGQCLIARQLDQLFMELGVRQAERLRVTNRLLFFGDQRPQSASVPPVLTTGRDHPNCRRFQDRPGLEDVGQGDVPGLEDQCRRAGGQPPVGSVHDNAALHATNDGNQALCLENPQGLPKRGP